MFLFSGGFVFAQDFEISSLILKVVIHEDESIIKPINVHSEEGGAFSLETSLSGVSIQEDNIILNSGETRAVDVVFDSNDLDPGVYVGSVMVKSRDKTSYLPIIFEVESKDLFFDVNLGIPPVYSEVAPGEKVVSQLDIFDLTSGGVTDGVGSTSVDLEYVIYRSDGTLINSETENVVVNIKTQLSKSILIPKNLASGEYVLGVSVKYFNSIGTSSSMFSVAKKERASFDFIDGGAIMFILIALIIVLFFIGMLFLFLYLIRDRDKLILELKRHNHKDLQTQREFLLARKKAVYGKKDVKKEEKEEFKRKMLAEIAGVKEKHRRRVKELKAMILKEAAEKKVGRKVEKKEVKVGKKVSRKERKIEKKIKRVVKKKKKLQKKIRKIEKKIQKRKKVHKPAIREKKKEVRIRKKLRKAEKAFAGLKRLKMQHTKLRVVGKKEKPVSSAKALLEKWKKQDYYGNLKVKTV